MARLPAVSPPEPIRVSRRYFGSCTRQLVARFIVTDETEKKRNRVARMKTRKEKVGWQQSSSRPAFRSFSRRYRKEGWLARTWDRSNWPKISGDELGAGPPVPPSGGGVRHLDTSLLTATARGQGGKTHVSRASESAYPPKVCLPVAAESRIPSGYLAAISGRVPRTVQKRYRLTRRTSSTASRWRMEAIQGAVVPGWSDVLRSMGLGGQGPEC